MTPSFAAAVSALTYSFVRERCRAAGESAPSTANRVARYVLACHADLPDYMRFPLRIATVALDASTLPATGKPLHLLSHEERWRRIERWRSSRLGPVRNVLRFYEGLAVFGWYGERHGDPT
jgi:hypothetical protein